MDKRIFLAEFLGTLLFVLFGMALSATPGIGFSLKAIGHGAALTILSLALGPVSGAALNPFITTALVLRGAINGSKALLHLSAQLLASLFAAALATLILPSSWSPRLGAIAPHPELTTLQASSVELLGTFFFTFTILRFLRLKRPFPINALGAGTALSSALFFAIPLSGGMLNFARFLGPKVFFGGGLYALLWQSNDWLIYLLAPLLGAIAAWIADRFFRCDEGCMCSAPAKEPQA